MIPCRCNQRLCQRRRSLKKRPELYVTWPKCRVHGCKGKMVVDECRLRKAVSDRGPSCVCVGYFAVHRKGQKNCIHRDEVVLDRAVRGIVKNSPFQGQNNDEIVPF